MDKKILLTFDLEEFDLPAEFGCSITETEQNQVTLNGLESLTGLLAKYKIPATFFTTSAFALRNPELVKGLAGTHEIASHSINHSSFNIGDLRESREVLENITRSSVKGFRMPRFAEIRKNKVEEAGYTYDSSVNPTLIPGRYNKLLAGRKIHTIKDRGLIEVPVSVVPLLRFPLFWLSFKNIPYPAYLMLCRFTLRYDSCLVLYFHPWEFAELQSFKIPWYIKSISGGDMLKRFERLIADLGSDGDFCTVSGYLGTAWENLQPA